MTRFCADCGGPLDRRGCCRRCGWVAPDAPGTAPAVGTGKPPKGKAPAGKTRPPAGYPTGKPAKPRSKHRGLKTGLIITAVIVGLLLIVILLQALNVLHIPFLGKLLGQEQYQPVDGNPYADDPYNNPHMVTPPDADSYYAQHGSVVSKQSAKNAQVLSEAEAIAELQNRGLLQGAVTADYDMNGNLLEGVTASASGTAKYPSYQSVYYTQSGELWIIHLIGGQIFAEPVSHNDDYDWNYRVMLSESNTLTSYDAASNSFYVTQPYSDSLVVKTVTRIDSSFLENLTRGEIDRL